MNKDDILSFLKKTIANLHDINEIDINLNSTFISLKVDSLELVELFLEFEKFYNLPIPDPEVDIRTIGDMVNYLFSCTNENT